MQLNQQNNKFSEVASQLIQMNDKIETLKTEVETETSAEKEKNADTEKIVETESAQ